MARVVLENFNKTFTGPKGECIRAVQNLGLTVEDGELLALVGPSGCGKTTTLRLIAGLEKPDTGALSIDGRALNDVPPGDRDIAMVFQNHSLFPNLTAYQNMAFGLQLRKFPEDETCRRVQQAAEMLGLTRCLGRKPAALSGGERQRVALGRALVRRPNVFLLDEPLSNLDTPMRAQMRSEISQLHARLGATMLYVTHDQVEAMTLGDRIAVMNGGVIQQLAEPLTLYDRPASRFVAGFIGSPPMNFFRGIMVQKAGVLYFHEQVEPGRSQADGFAVRVDGTRASALAPFVGKPVILGLRPEHMAQKALSGDASLENLLDAEVEVVEPIGAETYLRLRTGSHPFVVRVPSAARAELGNKISMVCDMQKAHFFDPTTDVSIW